MKKTITTVIIAFAALVLVNSQAMAANTLDLEDDMGEGLILNIQEDTTNYTYDSAIVDAGDFMSESDLEFDHAIELDHQHFAGDCSCPSSHLLMSEGICLKQFAHTLAVR
jgi:hypothetical protein